MMWWAVQTVVITAAMVVLIGFAGRWMRVMPAALHILWLLVLVRFVVPPVVEWPWPLTELAAPDAKAVTTDGGAVPFLRLVGDYVAPSAGPRNLPATAAPIVEAGGFTYPSISLVEWLLSVWAIAACAVFVIQFIRLVRVDRMLRAVTTPPAWMQEDVDALAARIAVSPPVVEVAAHLPVPVYWNLGRARLLIPSRLVDTFDRDAWNGVFLHELAHHKRRDHWVGWLELAASCIWWWNPIFWYARRRLREQAELACDAWVISEFPERRRAYADALLRVFESVSQNAERRLAWSTAADIRLGFERRLKMIYASTVSRSVSMTWIVVAAIMLALVTPGWSLENPALATPSQSRPEVAASTVPAANVPPASIPEDASESMKRVYAALDATVSIDLQNAHVAHVCSYLREFANVNIVLDYRVIEPETEQVPVMDSAAPNSPAPGPPVSEEGQKPPTIPSPTYVTDGMVPTYKIEALSVREALRMLCEPLNLDFEVAPGFIWISTPENIDSETWPLPPTGTGSSLEDTVIEKYIAVEFETEHVSRIVNFVGEYTKLKIVVDERVVEPAPDAEPGEAATEYVSTGMVPYIKMMNVTVHEFLLALLRPLNLAYRLESDFIWVSSVDHIGSDEAPPAQIEHTEPAGVDKPGDVDASAISVLRIVAWSDGSYRAEVATDQSRGFYGVGEAFERYEIRSIDPEKKAVEIFDAIENKVETLTAKQ